MEDAVRLHWLPCTISHTGPAKVSAYFLPKSTGVQVDGHRVEEAHFRGRLLKGSTLQLPEGYKGQVLVKQQDSQEESKWVQQASFTEITAWKHGVGPVRTDSAQKRLDYLKICQQMHAPMSEECISSELADNSFAPVKQ